MRIESRLELSSVRWLRETYDLRDTTHDDHFFRHLAHSAFPGYSIVAVEIDEEKLIHRCWLLETYIPGQELPIDLACKHPRPTKTHLVQADSIRPGEKSKLFVPESNLARYHTPFDKRPDRFLGRFEQFSGKVIVYRVSRTRKLLRFIGQCVSRVVNFFRRNK